MRTILPLSVPDGGLHDTRELSREAEATGFDAVAISEINSDPMLQLTLAAEATDRIGLMTNIVVAFARSPMTLALQATALQEYSGGRLTLGLGSQVRPHIERRFSMPWSAPARRMEEYVRALRAIWHAWETGEQLRFDGEFYTHTLMIPEYAPAVSRPAPEILVAAVGQRMTETAGAVADGVIIHPFTTERFLREVTVPALQRGAERGARPVGEVKLVAAPFVVSGLHDEEIARSRELVRQRIAFYGSTPAYRPVLDLHGWGELGEELNRMSKTADPQRWERMSSLVSDDMVATFAVEGAPEQVGALLWQRFGDLVDSLSINQRGFEDPQTVLHLTAAIRNNGPAS
ncbi:TIGR03617 family F420-dependent LLM class oxidoreductase [Nocardioides sp. LHD-245]|uniref:TIGR03617 family F420-dependent LLM class oxidoreductase n=1 Tax=Nocardioides sp. LHD-245 TaxID=3051387 RepID=UPI0027E0B3FF|nr:TIGR03617 family F420-dependent LLM class oxidoreductase [Nocardioides sp. LHD-245]